MALGEFLKKYRRDILQLCEEKFVATERSKPASELLHRGLPVFFDELIGVLQRSWVPTISIIDEPRDISYYRGNIAAVHGKESLRLGYSISQVVHFYGAVCQSITELAQIKSYEMTAKEFQDLNLCLDHAIAEAVTEYESSQIDSVSEDEIQRMSFFIHELRNSLLAATISHNMIQAGKVGIAGSTSKLLSRALDRIGHLIGSSLADVRLRGSAPLEQSRISLIDIINEVNTTMMVMSHDSRNIRLDIEADPNIHFSADRHLIFSALSNLVFNAMKFTKDNGTVSVRGINSGGRILIEVEDECGGIPGGDPEELFKPFVQKGSNKSGMGLGLPLSRRAIELNQGTLTARDLLGKGCVFTIDLPETPLVKEIEPNPLPVSNSTSDKIAA